ncbi:MAG: ribose 5-phosphate isomerase B [Candidatus Aenigmatarchaeota archaeon]|nr:MAG: ribose 5-phosphate isomerase B [Candidatus Aenigmarchaeota archaeon]
MIALGSDHAGFGLKEKIKQYLEKKGLEIKDYGCFSEESVDYPDYAEKVARAVSSNEAEKGILICGTGIGMSIAANKISGIRAAVCWDEKSAEMSRRHNDANILCIGARLIDQELALRIVDVWLSTGFDGGRHVKRVKKINAITYE